MGRFVARSWELCRFACLAWIPLTKFWERVCNRLVSGCWFSAACALGPFVWARFIFRIWKIINLGAVAEVQATALKRWGVRERERVEQIKGFSGSDDWEKMSLGPSRPLPLCPSLNLLMPSRGIFAISMVFYSGFSCCFSLGVFVFSFFLLTSSIIPVRHYKAPKVLPPSFLPFSRVTFMFHFFFLKLGSIKNRLSHLPGASDVTI